MVSLEKKKKMSWASAVCEPGCGAALPQGPSLPHLFIATYRPTDHVLGMGEGPRHLCAQTKGQSCGELRLHLHHSLGPPLQPAEGAEIALPKPLHELSPLPQLQPGSSKASFGKSHKLAFSRTEEFLPAHW